MKSFAHGKFLPVSPKFRSYGRSQTHSSNVLCMFHTLFRKAMLIIFTATIWRNDQFSCDNVAAYTTKEDALPYLWIMYMYVGIQPLN